MLTLRPTDDLLYQALLKRDAAYEGFAYVCVTSTRIFCRLTCPARKPLRENCRFEARIADCLEAGYRPCKRCTPLQHYGMMEPSVSALLHMLEERPDRRWSEQDVVRLGHDPSTIRRLFKRRFGMSFLELARRRRLSEAAATLGKGGSVIEAQLDAGFESGSGFRSAINQLLGEAPQKLKTREGFLRACWIETPIGPMLCVTCDHALHLLEFADRPALPAELRHLQERSRSAVIFGRTATTDQVEAELERYFAGGSLGFSVRIGGHGTPFERQVWEALREIQPGATRSYSAIAGQIGRPTAIRAVARANGANRIAIIIPCHRVIGADGSLTGYGGGLWRKQWLLRHEAKMRASRAYHQSA
ncbi:bifunctional transcriptional activator/DNA repair enzyme AdaA [Rhizobium sp. SSA_523]|uniref:bifunctional transcriptional activator/DNA repair enzyme AdaA n=1 Tax=Rhizobium sp. SSA_523 TaxID=2952477 RepID=UPI002090A15E|nr:trifunctional transcriptional activator/DNA repair protein Ada/methylated-DNA--[protein]-cysteine S-methyltransferase [Rhizobium sp. SSA_523]MCO5730838.1 trifunctional transcriptional activator/DNA repair protein Ada/methylated-DNA--[protein]-cysteine S-methyltransferase [Rhizobium sp. SSA_523]WKC24341.1 trifunctional transcriptional activator/DNA repair protein Ada/methylated-DNA--[protein]-cysteine S-methyltransferase [Rhizobium sp. SSA_523]